MADEGDIPIQAKSVKDVSPELFIEAYAAHLKTNDKVRSSKQCSSNTANVPPMGSASQPKA